MLHFRRSRSDVALNRQFAVKRLPWDALASLLWVIAFVLYYQHVIDVGPLGCTSQHNGPFFFQAATMKRWIYSSQNNTPSNKHPKPSPEFASTSTSTAGHVPTSQAHRRPIQHYSTPIEAFSYPCNSSLVTKWRFLTSNWKHIAPAVLHHPAIKQLLQDPYIKSCFAFPFLHLIVAPLLSFLSHHWLATAPQHLPNPSTSTTNNKPPHHPASYQALHLYESIPWWLEPGRTYAAVVLHLCGPILMLARMLMRPPQVELLPLSIAYNYSSASGNYFYIFKSWLMLMMMLPSSFHIPVALVKWALLTATGCLVDHQLLGSATAGWATYACSFFSMVGLTTLVVLAYEARLWRSQSAVPQRACGASSESSIASQRLLRSTNTSSRCSRHSPARVPAAPATSASPAAAAALPSSEPILYGDIVRKVQGARRAVYVSVKVPSAAPHAAEAGPCSSFSTIAQPCLARCSSAVQASARRAGLVPRLLSAHAFPGCVHVLMEVVLMPGEQPAEPAAGAAGEPAAAADGLQGFEGFDEALQGALHDEGPQQQQQQQPQVIAASLPVFPEQASAATWLEMPWTAIVNPVCVPAAAAPASSPSSPSPPPSLSVGLLPCSPARLPSAPRVVVTGYSLGAGAAGAGGLCHLLPPSQLWQPAGAGGSSHMSVTLPGDVAAPAVLTLHVLPPAGTSAGAAPVVHPLASLPLLLLPPAAAEEVQAMFGAMVGSVLSQLAAAQEVADVASAARHAYWSHYVHYVASWKTLAAAAAAAAAPAAAPAAAACSSQDVVDIAHLCAFLSARGMRACLAIAADMVAKAGLAQQLMAAGLQQRGEEEQLEEEVADDSVAPAGPLLSGAEEDEEEQVQQHEEGAAGSWAPASQDRQGGTRSIRASKPKPAATADSAAEQPSSKTTRQHPATPPSQAPPRLSPSSILLGFDSAATEAGYVVYKAAWCVQHVDVTAAMGSAVVVAGWLAAGHAAVNWEALPVWLTILFFNLPYTVLLLHRQWFTQHREVLFICLGGASRGALIFGQGVLSLVLGRDKCSTLPHCGWFMVACSVLQLPLLHQLRFLPTVWLTMLDAVGICCYVAAGSSSWAAGVLCAAGAFAAALAVTAALEWRSRAGYVAQLRHGQPRQQLQQ